MTHFRLAQTDGPVCWRHVPCIMRCISLRSGCAVYVQVVPSRFDSVAGTLMILAAYCNMFLNPLIYIAKYDAVKRPLVNWLKCNKVASQQQPQT